MIVRVISVEIDNAGPEAVALIERLLHTHAVSEPLLGMTSAPCPSPVAPPVIAAPSAEKPLRRSPRRPAKVSGPVAAAIPVDGDGCRAQVWRLLEKRPMTSMELVEACKPKLTASSVYLALKELRGAQLVVTKHDDNGEKRNYRKG